MRQKRDEHLEGDDIDTDDFDIDAVDFYSILIVFDLKKISCARIKL